MSKPLKEITKKIASGATPRGGKESYKDFGISLIRSQNILDFDFDYNGLAFIDEDQAQKLKNVIVEKNDILLNITGDSVARCSIVPEQVLPARVNQHVMIIRVDDKQANYKYVFYYLQYIKRYLLQLASGGATRNALTKTMIENLEYNHRSIEEQEAIANILSSLDDKIENNNAIIANLEEQAQAIFKSWFINFEPFQDEEFIDTELGLIPESFNVATFDDFVSISSGKRKKNSEKTADNIYPIIGASKITGYTDDYLFNEKVIITGRVGTLGTLQIYNSKIWPSDNTLILRSDFYAFTYFALKTINFSALNRGSTQPLVSQKDIKNSKVILPNMEWLSKFENILNPIINYYWKIEEENQKLIEIRDTLLPKLMSGEIRVEEAVEVE